MAWDGVEQRACGAWCQDHGAYTVRLEELEKITTRLREDTRNMIPRWIFVLTFAGSVTILTSVLGFLVHQQMIVAEKISVYAAMDKERGDAIHDRVDKIERCLVPFPSGGRANN